MIVTVKLHYNEGCINVIANEKAYWSGGMIKEPLIGKTVRKFVKKYPRFIYSGEEGKSPYFTFSR